jgi:polysaccharide biosynthesis/export protein
MNDHICRTALVVAGLSIVGAGCATTTSLNDRADLIAASGIPRELQKTSLPTYRVAPPDILIIEAVQNIRPPGDGIRAGDVLTIRLANPEPLTPPDKNATPAEQQSHIAMQIQLKFIDGPYRVQSDGSVDLGPVYGRVQVEGLTVEQAKEAVRLHLTRYIVGKDGKRAGIKDPQISVTMTNISGKQVIAGEHLVRVDGTIGLGVYGSVHVAGQTLEDVKRSVEAHLSRFINKPEVSVDVGAYNSQVYYVITDGGGYGETVVRLPCTGNETVLDAIANIQGLSQVSSKRIWVARPSLAGTQCAQVMDVNWREITQEGITSTNYQLLPGDRIYVSADHLQAIDIFLAKALAPVERIFGVTILGYGAVRTTQRGRNSGGGGLGGGGFGTGF